MQVYNIHTKFIQEEEYNSMPENFSLPPDTPQGQRNAIIANEQTITVGAGAGTGKTWVLSGRYARILIDSDEILPRDILTLTYTEAAAGDMKRRIESRLKDDMKNLHDLQRKRAIIDGLSDSWISTIHSFAARLIRESGLSLDIDPGASVISAQQEQEFWEDVKNAVMFADLHTLARAYGNKILQETAKFLDNNEDFSAAVGKWNAQNLSDLARNTAELHASSGLDWQKMLDWSEDDILINSTRPLVKNILLDEWRNVWEFFYDMKLPQATNPNGVGAALNNLLAQMSIDDINNDEALRNFYMNILSAKGGTGQPFTTFKDYSNGLTFGDWKKTRPKLIAEITQDYEQDFTEHELRMRKTLMKFCALSWGMWDIMKRRRGLLSFSDMILHAGRAIKEGSINKTFMHILVDEFQDTDPLQFAMIKSLADMSGNTHLFAVGDPKQSIYKFRHAEPALFAQTIKDANRKIELGVSFRTKAKLLTRINNLFASVWVNGLGNSEAMSGLRFEHVEPAQNNSERESGTMPDFMVILVPHNINTTNEAREILADNIAYKIALWVKEGRTIWDKDEKIIRPVRFSDFAILSRSRNIYETLEKSLDKLNIKSVQDRSNDFFSRGEINDVVCMLRAAADVSDDFAVAGWLMSPFSGVDEDRAIKACLEKVSDDDNYKPIEILRRDIPEAYTRLEYLSLVGEQQGPAELLSLFDKDRKWLECYNTKDRLRVLRNLRRAISIARKFQQSGTASLTACAEWLTRALRNDLSIEEPTWHDESENAVRLGVVHSAKGLEYPVTIIFESRVKKNSDHRALRPSKSLGLVFTNYPDEITNGDDIKPRGAKWESLLSEQGDAEEETRLFYVACTRAQDSLIFCGLIDEKNDEPHPNTWTKILLDNDRTINPEIAYPLNISESMTVNYNAPDKVLQPVKLLHTKNFLRQVSASSFSLWEWCPFAWRRRYRQGINLAWESPDRDLLLDDEYSGGADLGSLTHWVLAHWRNTELDYLLNSREVLSLLPGNLRDIWRDGKAKASMREWLEKFAVSDLGTKLRHENIKREYKFRVRLSDDTSLAGAIDAIYSDENFYHIIDYKITLSDKAPPGLYESQLDFYALAIHELTGHESIKTCIAFLREAEQHEYSYKNFDDIRSRVLHFAENGACGPYNANVKNCGLCPFRKGCVKNCEGQ